MNNDLISVIIPVYNAENYLDKCIESVVNQTYKNLEIILIDDGSCDNSSQICDNWAESDKRIKVFHRKNEGVSSSRNYGIKVSTGKFIAFVDSDDYISNNMYQSLYNNQIENSSDVVFCRFNQVEGKTLTKVFESNLQKFCESKDISFIVKDAALKYKNGFIQNTNSIWGGVWRSLFKSEIIKSHSFNEKLSLAEDALFLIETIVNKNIKISLCDEYLYNYVIHQNSLCRQSLNKKEKCLKIIENTIKFTQSIEKILKNHLLKDIIVEKYKFNAYVVCYLNYLYEKDTSVLKKIKEWKDKKYYKAKQKFSRRIKDKFLNFCVYHNLRFILKIINKLKPLI